MEGFVNLKEYDLLAKYYDELLADKDALSLWLNEINNEPYNTVLELASGSGIMAGILKNQGKDVIASDISKQMKKASKVNFDGEYLIINMSNYNLNKKFDLILCICDSFNYLNIDEINSFLNCSYNHLNNGGRLIFDSHHINRLEEFKDEFIEEGTLSDGTNYQFTILSDNNYINEHFTFYTKEGMLQEQHTQIIYSTDIILDMMNKKGFKTKLINDFVKDEKVLFIGKK